MAQPDHYKTLGVAESATADEINAYLGEVIEDNGIGISPESAAEIWKPYVQLNNVERDRERGLGLGLFLVQRIVEHVCVRDGGHPFAHRAFARSVAQLEPPLAQRRVHLVAALAVQGAQPGQVAGKVALQLRQHQPLAQPVAVQIRRLLELTNLPISRVM